MKYKKTQLAILALMLAVMSGGLFGGPGALAQDEDEEELGVALLFPDNDLFDEYVELTEETTGLMEDEWAAEFEDKIGFIQASTGSGISGNIFTDIGFLDEMFAGTEDFVVYGLLQFPSTHPLNPTEDRIERGIVLYITDEFLVIVLVDLSSDGEITAFAVFPRQENNTPLASAINLEATQGILLLLDGLENLNIVDVPTAPPEPQPFDGFSCAAGLNKTRDLNLTINGRETIAFGRDGSTDLYEVFLSSNRFIKVKSLQDDDLVQAQFNAVGVSRLVTLAGTDRNEEFELRDGMSFSLLTASRDVRTCVMGDVTDSNGTLRITGELHEN